MFSLSLCGFFVWNMITMLVISVSYSGQECKTQYKIENTNAKKNTQPHHCMHNIITCRNVFIGPIPTQNYDTKIVFCCCCFGIMSGRMSQVNMKKKAMYFIFWVFQVMLHNSGEYGQDSSRHLKLLGDTYFFQAVKIHIPKAISIVPRQLLGITTLAKQQRPSRPASFKWVFGVLTLMLIWWNVDNMWSITSYLWPASKSCWIIWSFVSISVLMFVNVVLVLRIFFWLRKRKNIFIFRGKGITFIMESQEWKKNT